MNMISYEGIGEVVVTVSMEEKMKAGTVVHLLDNDVVGPCEDGEVFCGVALKMGGSIGSMQVKGFVRVPFTGEMKLGWMNLVANGEGGVRPGENGLQVLVAQLDVEEQTAMICL